MMGRPPLGKVAMTGAERVRRYRIKHGITKPQRSPDVSLQTVTKRLQREADALRTQLAERDREIAQLRDQLKQAKAVRPGNGDTIAKPKLKRGVAMPDGLFKLINLALHTDAGSKEARLKALQAFNGWATDHVPGQMKKRRTRKRW
jgi:hypothetical protein